MKYRITRYDACVSGMEPLRNYYETMYTANLWAEMTAQDVAQQLVADVRALTSEDMDETAIAALMIQFANEQFAPNSEQILRFVPSSDECEANGEFVQLFVYVAGGEE
jgi:hypothetical protein